MAKDENNIFRSLILIVTAAALITGILVFGTETFAADADGATALFDFFTAGGSSVNSVSGTAISGCEIKVIYKKARKDAIMKTPGRTVGMRYSTDFGRTCKDIYANADASGDYEFVLRTGSGDRQLQVAFFTCDRYGHVYWDSNFGANYPINIVPASELLKRDRFNALEDGKLLVFGGE